MRRPLLALLGMLLTGCASTHKQPPPSTDVDDLLFREEVRMLASDELEGRRPGTPGEDKTVAFLTAQFRKLGLKPGNGESFVQQVPLIEATASARPTLTVLGRAGALPLAFGTDMVLWSPQSDPAVRLAHSGVVFVGYGIVAPEYDWNDYAQLDVRGKTVLVLDGDPGVASRDPTLFKGNALSVYGRAAYKLEEAGRQGAAAVLLVHDERSTGHGCRHLETRAGRLGHGGRGAHPAGCRRPGCRRAARCASSTRLQGGGARRQHRCDAHEHDPAFRFDECGRNARGRRAQERICHIQRPLGPARAHRRGGDLQRRRR